MSGAFVPADQKVRDLIRTSVGESMCVEAGAGTGKTSVLVRRVVELLRRGPFSVDEIAVMTFTDAAAAELASRIREGLEEACVTAQGEERRRLEDALTGLYRAQIETIHAFATGLLRERPVEAALDPRFTVLDPVAAEQRFDEAWREWLGRELAGDSPALAQAIDRGLDLRQLRTLADAVHRHRYLLPLDLAAPVPADVAGFMRHLQGTVERLARLIGSCIDESDHAFQAAVELIGFARDLADASPADRERILLFEPAHPSRNGNQGNWSAAEDCTEAKVLVEGFVEAQARVQEELRGEALAAALPLVEEFVAAHERRRREQGEADYDDLLIWARDLLRDRPEVLAYFRERFPRLFVDEFQDTDPLQAEIVMRIAGEGEKPLEERPGAGRVFVVGDPKQSIYRFRRADIGVYDLIKNGPLQGATREIVQNFRSHPQIIEWANRVFDDVLTEAPGVQPANTHLSPMPDGVDAGRPPIVVVEGSRRGGASAGENREEEGAILAGMITRAVEVERWPVRDRGDGHVRGAQYRDVAILLPARTEIDLYTNALEEAGIPYRVEGSRTFFERQEVRDLISCLKAIDDPLDTISLVGALRSRAFGCSDEELFLWRARVGRLDLRFDPPQDAGPEPVFESLSCLVALRRARRGLSLPALVRRVLKDTGLVELALSEAGGEQAAANLLKLAEQAHAFAGSGSGLRAFARWLAEQRDEETDESEAGAVEEIDNVVRLATIHSAKGLEYPIVMLANINRQIKKNAKMPIPDRAERRLHLSIGRGGEERGARFSTPAYKGAEAAEDEMIEAESRRLLYVAVTRARDHLVIPVVGEPTKEKGMLAWLLPHLPSAQEPQRRAQCVLVDAPQPGAAEKPRAAPIDAQAIEVELQARARWIERNEARVRAARSERPVVRPSERTRLWERPLTVEVTEAEGAVVATGVGDPLLLGDALHLLMEQVDLRDGSDLEQVAAAAAREYGIEERLDELLELARGCLASDAVAAAASAPMCWREVPFAAVDEDGVLTEGRMDLVYGDGGGLTIVDYKSDTVRGGVAAATAEHREQAAIYAATLARITGIEVARVVFVFARAGGAEGSLSADALA